MNAENREILTRHLITANRVLIALGGIDAKRPDAFVSPTLRECIQVYADLMKCRIDMPLSAVEAETVQGVLDRLQDYLRYFREDV